MLIRDKVIDTHFIFGHCSIVKEDGHESKGPQGKIFR